MKKNIAIGRKKFYQSSSSYDNAKQKSTFTSCHKRL